jgi:uncharacterized repeat protein (TIGR03806 family)
MIEALRLRRVGLHHEPLASVPCASVLLVVLASCSSTDSTRLYDPRAGDPGPRPAAFLQFPADTRQAPRPESGVPAHFPSLLSETGAFVDVRALEPSPGLVPYDLQAPLWSDGASKSRWLSLPELGSIVAADDAPWLVPAGTVLIKHFELALDERQPEARRRLETRLLVAAQSGSFYGVTYKWNADETDAEIVLEAQTEQLSIVDAQGQPRQQPYFYPGTRDCNTCHTPSAGFVLGLRTRQLNQELDFGTGFPALNQLLAWSVWGFLDRAFDEQAVQDAPRLANIADESESLDVRVRSYWDSNCSMCHAGNAGTPVGWDARFSTELAERGLDQPPQMLNPDLPGVLLDPGDPEGSYVFVRSATSETGLRMPPIGRNRIDAQYVDVLARWIESL